MFLVKSQNIQKTILYDETRSLRKCGKEESEEEDCHCYHQHSGEDWCVVCMPVCVMSHSDKTSANLTWSRLQTTLYFQRKFLCSLYRELANLPIPSLSILEQNYEQFGGKEILGEKGGYLISNILSILAKVKLQVFEVKRIKKWGRKGIFWGRL